MLPSPSGRAAPAENGAGRHGQVNRLLIEMSILANILLNTYSKPEQKTPAYLHIGASAYLGTKKITKNCKGNIRRHLKKLF
jgi:hypothetical protein